MKSAPIRCCASVGVMAIEDLDFAVEQLVGSLLGGTALRLSYRLPPIFTNEEDLARWVRSGVEAFLRAHTPDSKGDH